MTITRTLIFTTAIAVVAGVVVAAAVATIGSITNTASPTTIVRTAQHAQQPGTALDADNDELAYAVGFAAGERVAANLAADQLDMNNDAVIAGFADALRTPSKPAVTNAKMDRLLRDLERTLRNNEAERLLREDDVFAALAKRNAERAATYLERFKQQPGAVALPSGVVYERVTTGDGPPVGDPDVVHADIEVDLLDGTRIFVEEGRRIVMAQMIPGGRELLTNLNVGDRVMAIVPPDQAFGLAGEPPLVGPNEAIVFDITILSVGDQHHPAQHDRDDDQNVRPEADQ